MFTKSCHYCRNYRDSEIRSTTYRKEGKDMIEVRKRKCLNLDVFVDETDKACDDFVLSQKFFCLKLENWNEIACCVARQKKTGPYASKWPEAFDTCPCGQQAKLIIELVKMEALKQKIKPKLKIRKDK